jgi:hypothetical protein
MFTLSPHLSEQVIELANDWTTSKFLRPIVVLVKYNKMKRLGKIGLFSKVIKLPCKLSVNNTILNSSNTPDTVGKGELIVLKTLISI